MGNKSSSSNKPVADKKEEPLCVDCDIKNQKALPEIEIQNKSVSNVNSDRNSNPSASTSSAGTGQPCEESYGKVTVCMESNEGQITKCREEWDAFKQCHQDHRR
uniref:CHCH domain-containing protein n=1 Tax=Chaetoceros debilis TaxID=122233 RepID=A0A7S3PZS1_9STRA|mmetsp:Transcript_25574/g.37810  ORF Transcript_25574/g.37810 Transcript_25574/m.37810 type:complete len:104 (+) Transcript_25574:168-479(+)